MSRLPTLSSSKLIKILEKAGFHVQRQKGSHTYLKHPDRRATVVPLHKGEDIGRGLLRKILRDIRVEPEDFQKML